MVNNFRYMKVEDLMTEAMSPLYSVSTINHPFNHNADNAVDEETFLDKIADVGISLILLAAYSMVAASLCIPTVKERVSKQRHMHQLSGLSTFVYWVVTFFCDLSFYAISSFTGILVILILGSSTFIDGENFTITTSLIFLYGWAILPWSYLFQTLFRDSTLAFVFIFCGNLFTGIITVISILFSSLLNGISPTKNAVDFVARISLCLPQYSFCFGFVELSKNQLKKEIMQSIHLARNTNSLFAMEQVGSAITSLAIQPIVVIVIFITWKLAFLTRRRGKKLQRIFASDETDDPVLRVTNLRKNFNTKTALNNVSFDVNAGECFGLLGSNGAGKTTTFGILSGEISMWSGEIRMRIKKIGTSGLIGYCPQENTLDELLTVGETFWIYGSIQGLTGEKLSKMIKIHLRKYHLFDCIDQLTKSLSGGYKRLVCLALSTFNDYKLILLDEPTAGVDQNLRKIIHVLLKSEIDKGRALLLTTHCLEDCEYLCRRMVIMNEGSMLYTGALDDFANWYGGGRKFCCNIKRGQNVNELLNRLRHQFPSGFLMTRNVILMKYYVDGISFNIDRLLQFVDEQGLQSNAWYLENISLDELFVLFMEQTMEKMN